MLTSWAVSVAAKPTTQVELFIDAFNKYDIEKMLEKTSEVVKWLHIINDMLLIEINDMDALRIAMDAHFNQPTHARSQIKQFLDSVAAREEAFSKDAEHSLCVLSIK